MSNVQHILLPTDFSPSSNTALAYAADMAVRFDATVDVVHAWTPPPDMHDLALWLAADASHTADRAKMLNRVKSRQAMSKFLATKAGPSLRETLSVLEARHVRQVRGRLESGLPSQVILDLAERDRYDLIVMASHGRTGLADVLIGSCCERVVRRSPIPVLVLPIPRHALRDGLPWRIDDADQQRESGWVRAGTT